MRKILTKVLLFIMQSKIYEWLLMHVIPYIRFKMYYTSFRGWKYKRGYKLLRPGDIILTKDKWKLTSFLIPGEFAHAALCLAKGEDEEFEVAEMTHKNFTKSAFFDICKESDRVVIIRCDDWDENYVETVISTCKSYEDVKYDIAFKLGIKALYCSELIVMSDPEKRLDVSYNDLVGMNRPYISPVGLYYGKNVTVIWDSDKEIVA